MAEDLEQSIDELYAGALDDFISRRDALAKARAASRDAEGSTRVRALRKPVVSMWALNRLAREDPQAVADLAALGERLRAAQRRAISGGDVEPLRTAIDERRRLITDLTKAASEILEGDGISPASHRDDLVATLEAAAADQEAAALLRSGRLVKPLRPPSTFDEVGLRVLEGGRAKRETRPAVETETAADEGRARELERALAAATRRERSSATAVERARRRLEELDAKRAEAKDALQAAEAEHRGAEVEIRRLTSELRGARRTPRS